MGAGRGKCPLKKSSRIEGPNEPDAARSFNVDKIEIWARRFGQWIAYGLKKKRYRKG